MKKYYYVVEKQLDSTGESLNGLKTINLYMINNNSPIDIGEFEIDLRMNSQDEIEDFLFQNDYIDQNEKIMLIQL